MFEYILILNPSFAVSGHPSYRYTINALDDIEKFPRSSRVELKIDTGMHRNGIAMEQLEEAFAKIESCGLELEGLFTHYRSADALSGEWFWQKKNFEQIKEKAQAYKKKTAFSLLQLRSTLSRRQYARGDGARGHRGLWLAVDGRGSQGRRVQIRTPLLGREDR